MEDQGTSIQYRHQHHHHNHDTGHDELVANSFHHQPHVGPSTTTTTAAAASSREINIQCDNDASQPPEKMCRICHGGEDEGRLISPCKCKGSMKYVHIDCLNTWRKTTVNPQSYFQCENCKYRYNLQRTKASSLLSSELFVDLITVLVFMILIIVGGFVGKGFERAFLVVEEPTIATDVPASQQLLLLQQSSSWLEYIVKHVIWGSIVVGFGGFFQLLVSWNLHFIRFFGPGGGAGGGGGAAASPKGRIEMAVVVIIVIIGLVKCLVSIYGLVKRITKAQLTKVETYIVEVSEE